MILFGRLDTQTNYRPFSLFPIALIGGATGYWRDGGGARGGESLSPLLRMKCFSRFSPLLRFLKKEDNMYHFNF